MSAAALPAPAAAAATGSLDSKYTVFFTGIFTEGANKDLVFEGNLAERPGLAMTRGNLKQSSVTVPNFDRLITGLVNENVCSGNVDPKYIFDGKKDERVYDKNPIRVVLYGPQPAEAAVASSTRSAAAAAAAAAATAGSAAPLRPVAFLIGRFEEGIGLSGKAELGVYIEIICSFKSLGVGTSFLNYFHRLMPIIDVQYVRLSSLASVVTYYPRLGYSFRESCNPSKPSFDGSILESFRLTKETRTKRNSKGKPVWVDSTDEAVADEDYLNFLLFLHSKGLTVKDKEPCDNKRLTADPFIENGCAIDGFKMARCDLSEYKAEADAGIAAAAAARLGGAGTGTGKAGGSRRSRRRTTRRHKK